MQTWLRDILYLKKVVENPQNESKHTDCLFNLYDIVENKYEFILKGTDAEIFGVEMRRLWRRINEIWGKENEQN